MVCFFQQFLMNNGFLKGVVVSCCHVVVTDHMHYILVICSPCLWTVNSGLPLRFSQTFIFCGYLILVFAHTLSSAYLLHTPHSFRIRSEYISPVDTSEEWYADRSWNGKGDYTCCCSSACSRREYRYRNMQLGVKLPINYKLKWYCKHHCPVAG